jgi:hypothetical protein
MGVEQVSRYAALIDEMRKIGREATDEGERIDPSHALQRVAVLERVVAGQMWLIAQILKELAKRDGVDVA